MKTPHSPDLLKFQAQRGVSLIEVLVTLMIISLAMLGAVGLQAQALRLNQGGQSRSQAVYLASDLAERIEANKGAAVLAGSYEVALTSTRPSPSAACTVGSCTEDQLADYDLAQWGIAVFDSLPQASWEVVRTVSATDPSTFQYQIKIYWVDRGTNATGTSSADTFSYIATRFVRV
ncbi:MAG: type IV pilus modification protein PilV [Ramlibacter sp.]